MKKILLITLAVVGALGLLGCASQGVKVPNDVEVLEIGDEFMVNDLFLMTIDGFELSDDSNEDHDVYNFSYNIVFQPEFSANSKASYTIDVLPEGSCLHTDGLNLSVSRMASGSQVPSSTRTTTTVFMAKDIDGELYLSFEDIWVKVK